jgi:hypothetical protein
MTKTVTPTHTYHASAHVFHGHLERPIEQNIEPQAPISLNDRRGGHFTRFVEDVSVEGFISFTRGETRVSGARSVKHNGWVTLSTSIVEGLNVFEVITADRMVSQVSTDHPPQNGHTPSVTFLGTRFENLQIGGFPVQVKLNLGICGEKPAGDASYFHDEKFLNSVRKQMNGIAKASGLPKEVKEQYDEKLNHIEKLLDSCGAGSTAVHEPITCSLVEDIIGDIPIPGIQRFGHVLMIPHFGTVALGEIEVGERMHEDSPRPNVYFEVTGVNMNLGCIGHGQAKGVIALANGHNHP